LGRSREMMIKMGKSLIKAAEKVGLRINEEKQSTWWSVREMGIRYKKNSLKWKNTNLKKWTNSNT